ncbi:hypothetical protein [uncultured Winogradskyella sp.]|uniref:FKBP-type peptidyl-prolyl cis-trans isomerase n=1 Tax=uncultured Winogradskyella sp. TaxID=395353 RepID=UPI0026219EB5|nr:hypothetical protein [uncultured Winogradskyella sp.]
MIQKYYFNVSCDQIKSNNEPSIRFMVNLVLEIIKHMKIKALKFGISLLMLLAILISCEEDDNSTSTVPVRDRTEQQVADRDSLLAYLSTHYYNSGFFEPSSDYEYTDIIITELPQDDDGNYLDMPDPDNNTLLIDAVETLTTTFLDTEYEYYVLRLNQGEGVAPKFTDAVRFRFEGSIVETKEVFQSISTPSNLNLQADGFGSSGSIKAWQLVMPTFNTATGFTLNNGIVDYDNYGLGVMFVPSGLAYFSAIILDVPVYSNLIFKFELLQHEEVDHDNDGIPSYVEDYNNDEDVLDNDTDEDDIPDFVDFDDDGDGITTFNELVQATYNQEPVLAENEYIYSRDETSEGIVIITVTAQDTNSNGILDYLDDSVSINYNEDEE